MVVPTKEIFVLVGLPFAGKTTYAQTLVSEDAELISRDRILEDINNNESLRISLLQRSQKTGLSWNDVVTQEYVQQVKEKILASQASLCVIDGTHLGVASRSFVGAFPNYHSTAIVFSTSVAVCRDRLKQANLSGIRSTITPELITHLQTLFVLPSKEEGFSEIRFL